MIPVKPADEPADFNDKVRQPGLRWAKNKKLDLDKPMTKGDNVSSYWSKCADQLWASYNGICAYSCFYIHRTTGAATVEHFAPKSRKLGLAFEWSNFRLVCGLMNARKSDYEDVLDPFRIPSNTFEIDFVTGEVHLSSQARVSLRNKGRDTIKRLRLNDPKCCADRLEPFNQYVRGEISLTHMRSHAPFVWYEADRQGLLR